jgi:hypothetical protein
MAAVPPLAGFVEFFDIRVLLVVAMKKKNTKARGEVPSSENNSKRFPKGINRPEPVRPVSDMQPLADQLREAIISSGLPKYTVARLAGITPGALSLFLRHERTIHFETAEKLCDFFQMRFTKPKKPKKRN